MTAIALPRTVRAKLLIAIAAMLTLMLGSGILAISGLNRTGSALTSLSEERLPDILSATRLAQQSTALAALAPFVSSVEVMNQLEAETVRIDGMIRDLGLLVADLPDSASFAGEAGQRVRDLARGLSQAIGQLLEASRKTLELRAEMVELQYGFERHSEAQEALVAAIWTSPRLLFAEAVEIILVARIADGSWQLDQLEARFQTVRAGLAAAELPARAAWIPRFLDQQNSLFNLRRSELQSQQRVRFLLASIHTLSADMGAEVARIIATTSAAAQTQSEALSATLERTKRNITILGVIALAAAALTALYILTDLARNLDAVTRAMSRLAAGDRSAGIPGLQRNDELGSLARAASVFKDASFERERLAEQVIKGNRLVEATFTNMSDGISVFDRDQRLISWNPRFLTMTGLAADSIRHGTGFGAIADQLRAADVTLHGLHGGQVTHLETANTRSSTMASYEMHHPDGRVIEIRSQPMPEGGFVTVYMDQTDRRRIERQLHQAQRMEAVGQLTGGIAHDFNNFLAAISGNLQMLQDRLFDDPELSQRILRALDATERAASVTERLLAFSRQQALRPVLTRVDELMFNLLELLGYRLAPTVEIRAEIAPDLPAIVVDPGQLESAVLNLLFNARDALPEGGTVTLSAALQEGALSLMVADQGIGMSQAVLARIYEPFFTTKSNGRGSGLGLSMVYGFIAQSGGEISVESQPGAGTRVRIRLPLPEDLSPSATFDALAETSEPGQGQHILLVEDDPLVRETVADILLSLGYQVRKVPDARSAREALAQSKYDLLLTDVLLPEGLTGLDVARDAATLQPGLPVLFTSGYMQVEGAGALHLPEGARLLRKPYRKSELARAISSSLHPPTDGAAA
ncbi:PAS-domain containing protein [Pseudomonas sp. GX19020]|uniref:hybrid sensor histidine kinase/response regulator n=1 Tax=Pseudomonas sp. GX19020 TaxID=2942277 RepID=UPI002018A575|nr:PAS-domain containing protein [Pseudomonas sp. GX19020]MCL4068864.1 PAS-domain containing protein [Pseudomonas sp. GX19020]